MSFLRDTSLSAVASLVGTGSRFVANILLARTLAPDAYGRFVFLQFVIDLLIMIYSIGIPGLLTRYLAQSPSTDLHKSELIRRVAPAFFAIMAVTLISFLVYAHLDRRFVGVAPILLAGWCVVAVMWAFLTSALYGLFRYDAVAIGNVGFAVVAPLSALFLAREGAVWSGAATMALSLGASVVFAVGASYLLPKPVTASPGRPPPARRELASYGFNIWITGLISGLVWSRGEFAVLRMYLDSSHIAVYAAAITLSSLVTQSVGLATGAITPHLVKRLTAQSGEKADVLLLGVSQMAIALSVVSCLLLVGAGRDIIAHSYGAKYAGLYPLLCIMAVSTTSIVSGSANVVLQVRTNARFGLVVNALALGVLIAATASLTPLIGTTGAALGRALAQVFVAALTFWQLSRISELKAPAGRLIQAWLVTVAVVGACALLFSQMTIPLILALLIVVAVSAVSWLAISRLLGGDIRQILRMA